MIIIEGPDRVGKTTLAKKILERLPTHIYSHFTRLPSEFDHYWGYVDRISENIVQDRFHLSEIIYSEVRGEQESPLTTEGYKLVNAALRLRGAFTVVITTTTPIIKERWDNNEMYSLDKTILANHLYLRHIQQHSVYTEDVDWFTHCTQEKPYVTDSEIDELLERYKNRREVIHGIQKRRVTTLT